MNSKQILAGVGVGGLLSLLYAIRRAHSEVTLVQANVASLQARVEKLSRVQDNMFDNLEDQIKRLNRYVDDNFDELEAHVGLERDDD